MIKFVNAKINLGLNVVRKRPDGYHDLETVFFPVGIESGMPQQPEPFDDILETTVEPDMPDSCRLQLMGRRVDCSLEDNLVFKATKMYLSEYFDTVGFGQGIGRVNVTLDKHLPDGAGLGGGSADASFTLMALNELLGNPVGAERLMELAAKLGADCPFFLVNSPCFAEGTGDILTPVDINLRGMHLLIVKPDVHVSTRDAFGAIVPREPAFDLRGLGELPLAKWRDVVVNDFEATVFPLHPELGEVKEELYGSGAVYASMSGSGSSLYGIYGSREAAERARGMFATTYQGVWLFKL